MRKFGTGDGGLAMHQPGFRVTDVPPSDELQRAREAYEHELTTAWERGTGKEGTVSDAQIERRLTGSVKEDVGIDPLRPLKSWGDLRGMPRDITGDLAASPT